MAKSLAEQVLEDQSRLQAAHRKQILEAAIQEKAQQRYMIALNVQHGTGDQTQAEEALEIANTELEGLESELEKLKKEMASKRTNSKSISAAIN